MAAFPQLVEVKGVIPPAIRDRFHLNFSGTNSDLNISLNIHKWITYPQYHITSDVPQSRIPTNDKGLPNMFIIRVAAQTHTVTNTITFSTIPSLCASGYEPGDALLVLRIGSQSVQANSSNFVTPHLYQMRQFKSWVLNFISSISLSIASVSES